MEEAPEGSAPGTWRGHITHFPDQEHSFVQGFNDVIAFIRRYLEGMGVQAE